MSEVLTIIILTGLAGACIPLGGLLARFEKFRPQWLDKEFRHFVIAFGGGILIGAIAVVLVPGGQKPTQCAAVSDTDLSGWGIMFFWS